MRPPVLPLFLALTTCGTAQTDSGLLSFEIRHLEAPGGSGSLLTVVDRDGDGATDIVLGSGEKVVVFRGDGNGAFRRHQGVDAGPGATDAAPGDVDTDGRLDLLVANHDTGYLTLLFGGADGLDAGRTRRLPVDVSPHPHAVALADLDGDGHPDLLVDDRGGEGLLVRKGLGDGIFGPDRRLSLGGDPYRGFALADVDGDGVLDIVAPAPHSVTIRWGRGDGTFLRGPRLEAAGLRPFSVAVGDVDGDGVRDVVAGSGEAEGMVVAWRGVGTRAFELAPGFPADVGEGPVTVAVGPLDGHGGDEVVATSYAAGEMTVIGGVGASTPPTRLELAGSPWGVATADLDGDGRRDVVVAGDGDAGAWVLLNRGHHGSGLER
jgi:hypothetical protein